MYNFKQNNNLKILSIVFMLLLLILCFNTFNKNTKPIFAESDYYYTSNVEHLFTHCLIAYPEIAFSVNNHMSNHYFNDCITAKEFIKILDELYLNDYILVNLSDCFTLNKNGEAIKKKVKVPVGKKPLILSFDDVNYDHKKQGLGMIDKLILDTQGNIATYTKFGNKIDIQYDNEFIPILENFIKLHKDFSLNNAKGTINLTGYDGIFGYRTSHTNNQNRENEIKEAKRIAQTLKNNGWEFASHSYGHYHMKKISDQKFEKELKLWQEEVASIVGPTQVYVYPYGEWEIFNNNKLTKKHQLLKDYGFKLFCGVGMSTFYSYIQKDEEKVLFMDRKAVDGYTISNNKKELNKFFNPKAIIDISRDLLKIKQ